jgi:Flp pilus assembly protein TadG
VGSPRRPRRRFSLGDDRGGALRCDRLRGDGGSSAIEFVMLTPIMFFLIFATVQVAMYSFAKDVAKAAAQAAARTARAEADADPENWIAKAEQTADNYITGLAGEGILGDPDADIGFVRREGVPPQTVVRAVVTGTAVSIVPGWPLEVSESSEGPVERFIPDEG